MVLCTGTYASTVSLVQPCKKAAAGCSNALANCTFALTIVCVYVPVGYVQEHVFNEIIDLEDPAQP